MRCPPRMAPARPAQDGSVVDLKADQEQVSNALAQLSGWQRAVIHRSCCLGRTTTQIAAEFRTEDDLVKQELHNALHALRVALLSASDRSFG